MKIAYFDCFSGASGDMILGSLLDAGLGLEELKGELAKLRLSHFEVRMDKVSKQGIGGTRAIVAVDEERASREHRHLGDIEAVIGRSPLEEPVKQMSLKIFKRLAEAEARVHRTTIEQIHFHEVGALDAIVDVVGACIGLARLGIHKVYCSEMHVGSGTVTCRHGTLPVPAPATAELVRGKPVYSTEVKGELLTPTGAAILTTLASGFGPMPSMALESVGYGAGSSELTIPNLLRVFIGDARDEATGYETDSVAVLETNIDDMNPQVYEYVMEMVLRLGALDVFFESVHMKKNRPGILLTILCEPHRTARLSHFIMQETTSIGVRLRMERRIKALREVEDVQTPYGTIRCKVAWGNGRIVNVAPEYEDCKRAALKNQVPLKHVMEEAKRAVQAAIGQHLTS